MNGKCAGITDLIDADSDRLDAVAVILLAAGLECKCCPSLQCAGWGSWGGRGGDFGRGPLPFPPPPETLLEVNSYRFPVLSSLPHTLSLSCRSFQPLARLCSQQPRTTAPLFSFSPPTHCCPPLCLLTAPPSYCSLTRVNRHLGT